METEEAIVLKLQEKNQEYREETERLIDERNHILSIPTNPLAKKNSHQPDNAMRRICSKFSKEVDTPLT